jgi:hypothetical protein
LVDQLPARIIIALYSPVDEVDQCAPVAGAGEGAFALAVYVGKAGSNGGVEQIGHEKSPGIIMWTDFWPLTPRQGPKILHESKGIVSLVE